MEQIQRRKKRLSRPRKRSPTLNKKIDFKPEATKNKPKLTQCKITKPKTTKTIEKHGKSQKVSTPIEDIDIREDKNKKEPLCPECSSNRLINDHERGEIVCGNCGLVIDDDQVDMGPEWRAFEHELRNKHTPVGAPINSTIHDKSLYPLIDWRNKDIYGRDIPARNRAQWYRLRKWQRKIMLLNNSKEYIKFVLSEIDRVSSRLGLPRSVRESAAIICQAAIDKNLISRHRINVAVATSIYTACRRFQVPRTTQEIRDVTNVSWRDLSRTYRLFERELNKRPPISPIDYVPSFASELNLSGVVQSKAIEIINQAMDNGLTSGRGPNGVAAAALYIASVLLGERKTMCDVADIAGISEVTIRNRYRELTEQLDINIILP